MKTGVIIRANLEHGKEDLLASALLDVHKIALLSDYKRPLLALPDNGFHRRINLSETGFDLYLGDPENMLSRMIGAAGAHGIETIIDLGLRDSPGPPETVEQMITFHRDSGGGYTEPWGWRKGYLPRIADLAYLEAVAKKSLRWPYYDTVLSYGMAKNVFAFPFKQMQASFLNAMDMPHLIALKARLDAMLDNQERGPENPQLWLSRAQRLVGDIEAYRHTKAVSVLEIGCGQRFGLGIILYLMGIESYTGVDIRPVMGDNADLNLFHDFLRDFSYGSPLFSRSLPEKILRTLPSDTCQSYLGGKVMILSPNDAASLPVADNEYDVIFSDAVFEHIKDPVWVCREMLRVLKPGGIMFHTIAFEDHHPDGSGLRHLYCSKKTWQGSCQQVFINLYRYCEFEAIFKDLGFHILSCVKNRTVHDVEMESVHNDYRSFDADELTLSSVSLVMGKKG